MERAFGTQNWRKLLFLHWTLPVERVREHVPAGLELDLWKGEAFVGVIPFVMEDVRPRFIPKLLAMQFLETNVRTYVRRNGEPGVYFFSLEAASRLAVIAARASFGLPYHYARMSLHDGTYQTVRERGGARLKVTYRVGGAMQKGALEHFLVERYLLFVKRGEKILRAQVQHVPYPLQSAAVLSVEDSLVAAAGLPAIEGAPRHVCFSPGVDVEVFVPRPA
jgi:uncharacterized protein YqjF (DUF2071 family)